MSTAVTLHRWRHRCAVTFFEAGWPAAAAAGLVVAGAMLWGATNWLEAQAARVGQSTREAVPGPGPSGGAVVSPASALGALVTSRDWYLDDVEYVFRIASEHGVQVAGLAYDREIQRVGDFEVQSLGLRLKGDYPKVKAFLAGLLAALPHVYLADLRLERGSPTAFDLDGTLKISFIYRAPVVHSARGAP